MQARLDDLEDLLEDLDSSLVSLNELNAFQSKTNATEASTTKRRKLDTSVTQPCRPLAFDLNEFGNRCSHTRQEEGRLTELDESLDELATLADAELSILSPSLPECKVRARQENADVLRNVQTRNSTTASGSVQSNHDLALFPPKSQYGTAHSQNLATSEGFQRSQTPPGRRLRPLTGSDKRMEPQTERSHPCHRSSSRSRSDSHSRSRSRSRSCSRSRSRSRVIFDKATCSEEQNVRESAFLRRPQTTGSLPSSRKQIDWAVIARPGSATFGTPSKSAVRHVLTHLLRLPCGSQSQEAQIVADNPSGSRSGGPFTGAGRSDGQSNSTSLLNPRQFPSQFPSSDHAAKSFALGGGEGHFGEADERTGKNRICRRSIDGSTMDLLHSFFNGSVPCDMSSLLGDERTYRDLQSLKEVCEARPSVCLEILRSSDLDRLLKSLCSKMQYFQGREDTDNSTRSRNGGSPDRYGAGLSSSRMQWASQAPSQRLSRFSQCGEVITTQATQNLRCHECVAEEEGTTTSPILVTAILQLLEALIAGVRALRGICQDGLIEVFPKVCKFFALTLSKACLFNTVYLSAQDQDSEHPQEADIYDCGLKPQARKTARLNLLLRYVQCVRSFLLYFESIRFALEDEALDPDSPDAGGQSRCASSPNDRSSLASMVRQRSIAAALSADPKDWPRNCSHIACLLHLGLFIGRFALAVVASDMPPATQLVYPSTSTSPCNSANSVSDDLISGKEESVVRVSLLLILSILELAYEDNDEEPGDHESSDYEAAGKSRGSLSVWMSEIFRGVDAYGLQNRYMVFDSPPDANALVYCRCDGQWRLPWAVGQAYRIDASTGSSAGRNRFPGENEEFGAASGVTSENMVKANGYSGARESNTALSNLTLLATALSYLFPRTFLNLSILKAPEAELQVYSENPCSGVQPSSLRPSTMFRMNGKALTTCALAERVAVLLESSLPAGCPLTANFIDYRMRLKYGKGKMRGPALLPTVPTQAANGSDWKLACSLSLTLVDLQLSL